MRLADREARPGRRALLRVLLALLVVVTSLGMLGDPQGLGKVVRHTEQRAVVLTRTAWGVVEHSTMALKAAAERPVPRVTTRQRDYPAR
jgi:hypothetical protein